MIFTSIWSFVAVIRTLAATASSAEMTPTATRFLCCISSTPLMRDRIEIEPCVFVTTAINGYHKHVSLLKHVELHLQPDRPSALPSDRICIGTERTPAQ